MDFVSFAFRSVLFWLVKRIRASRVLNLPGGGFGLANHPNKYMHALQSEL